MDVTVDRPEVFPSQTKVGLYHEGHVPDPTGAPTAAALQTQQVGFVEEKEGAPVFDSKTAITFAGLTTRNYLAGAKVGGVWRYVRIVGGVLGASLKPPARYPNHGI